MFQKITATGYTNSDLRLTFLGDGKPVANFVLRVNRNKGKSKKADFIPCVVWEDEAKELTSVIGKGSLIYVEGEWRSSTRDNDRGGKDYFHQLEIDSYEILKAEPVGIKEDGTEKESKE